MSEVAIGIDIGGTYTKIGIVDKTGNCLCATSIPTGIFPNIDTFIIAIEKEIEKLSKHLAINIAIKGIGIGAPNGNHFTGTIDNAPNLNWGNNIPIQTKFSNYFKLDIVIDNDANTAAIGEMIYGSAKGMDNFIVITLGTGLGSGFIANGQLIHGHTGFAGELGHTTVDPNGRPCKCGKTGCLEKYVSASGIVTTANEMLTKDTYKSFLKKNTEIDAKTISEAAKKGDKLALDAYDFTAKILGEKLADIVAITNPEAIFLLGGLAKSGELLFAPTRIYLEKNLMNIHKNKIKLAASGLANTDAAILGAAAMVWKK